MTLRPRLLLLIPHLGGGGAERVIALLAANLSPEKYDLHLGVVAHAQRKQTLDLPPHVKVHLAENRRVRYAAPNLLHLTWRVRPQVIVSGMAHLNLLVLLLQPLMPRRTRIIVRQNATFSRALATGSVPLWTRLLYRTQYPRAERILCQSPEMADDLSQSIPVKPDNLVVLPNPIDDAKIEQKISHGTSRWHGPGPHILSVGRLSHEKGIDALLRAISELREAFPTMDVTILGDGPQDSALQSFSRALGLDDVVTFAGHVSDPAAYYRGASLLVVSSRHEAMPNAMLEAAAGGLPVVATPASPAIVRLLQNDPGAWLAADASAQALAAALHNALGKLQPGERFIHSWIEPFRLKHAISAYESLFDSVVR